MWLGDIGDEDESGIGGAEAVGAGSEAAGIHKIALEEPSKTDCECLREVIRDEWTLDKKRL